MTPPAAGFMILIKEKTVVSQPETQISLTHTLV